MSTVRKPREPFPIYKARRAQAARERKRLAGSRWIFVNGRGMTWQGTEGTRRRWR